LIAPFTAGVIAFLATRLAYAMTRRYDNKPDGRDGFRWGQIFTSSLVALAHGTNDAQKTMGVITLALIMAGWQSGAHADPQLWVILACAFTIALGTYMGGWRIIRTLGKGLTDVKPAQGFSAETSTAATILASSALGFALSTTQVASGSVIGSGLGRRGSKVRWRTVGRIAVGWVLTLPASAAVGAFAALLVVWFGGAGIVIDAVLAVAIIVGLFLRSRRTHVDSSNAMSEVADSGLAVKVKRNPPPTRRQRAILRASARRKADRAKERAKSTAPAEEALGHEAFGHEAFAEKSGAEKTGSADGHQHRLVRLRPGLRRRLDRCAARRRLLRGRSSAAGARGRAPIVAPAEFTDAITVISEKEARRAAKAAAKAAKKSPSPTGRSVWR
jgi:PiT family inorganic phosphate transporter